MLFGVIRKVALKRVLILVFSVILTACSGTQYTFQTFTFPQSIPAHKTGWTYQGRFNVISSDNGSMFQQSNKKVQISIENKNGNQFLSESFEYTDVSGLKAEVIWLTHDHIQIKVFEYGSSNYQGAYSQELFKNGDKLIGILKYEFNHKNNLFKLVKRK